MSKDYAEVVSLVMHNKHGDAIEWLNKHFENHPLSSVSGNVFLNGEYNSVEELLIVLCKVLTYFTILHRCVAVLTKVRHLMRIFITIHADPLLMNSMKKLSKTGKHQPLSTCQVSCTKANR